LDLVSLAEEMVFFKGRELVKRILAVVTAVDAIFI
jgi:hypothetical protein